jgi:hypothetical protein
MNKQSITTGIILFSSNSSLAIMLNAHNLMDNAMVEPLSSAGPAVSVVIPGRAVNRKCRETSWRPPRAWLQLAVKTPNDLATMRRES